MAESVAGLQSEDELGYGARAGERTAGALFEAPEPVAHGVRMAVQDDGGRAGGAVVGGPQSQSVEQDVAVVGGEILEPAQDVLYDAVRDLDVGKRDHGQRRPVEDSHRIC